jgi:hypothetical protein
MLKFKVGDKVYIGDNVATVYTIVFIADKCLCVYKNLDDSYSSRWTELSKLTPVPQFKLYQVWEMRDGDHGEIVSISSLNMIVVYSKNSVDHGTVGLDLNGRYYATGTLSDYDLVRQIR